jgi:ABC-type Fe3+/spermidine/putrescine transport system ATPase subunit
VQEGATKVVVAVRPEKLNVATERPDSGENAVKGKIVTIAYLGDRRHYYVSVEGRAKPIAVAAQEVKMRTDPSLGEGKDVWLTWSNDSLMLLRAD